MSELKEKIAISLDAELLRRVDAVAEALGQSRSAAIERVLRYGISGQEKFVKKMEDPAFALLWKAIGDMPSLLETVTAQVLQALSKEEEDAVKDKMGRSKRVRNKDK